MRHPIPSEFTDIPVHYLAAQIKVGDKFAGTARIGYQDTLVVYTVVKLFGFWQGFSSEKEKKVMVYRDVVVSRDPAYTGKPNGLSMVSTKTLCRLRIIRGGCSAGVGNI